LSQAPDGFESGDVNLYTYAFNNPLYWIDPSGLWASDLSLWQWAKVVGVGVYEFGAAPIRAGKAVVTGEAGAALGERALAMQWVESGEDFTGDFGDWSYFFYILGRDVVGANALAEGAVGVDMANLVEIDGWERATRFAGGTAALAGIFAGVLSAAGKFGCTWGGKTIPGTPSLPRIPIPNVVRNVLEFDLTGNLGGLLRSIGPASTKMLENLRRAWQRAKLGGVRSANPIAGLPRTGNALKTDPTHAFPNLVDNFVGDARKFSIPTREPGGAIVRQSDLYQLEGSYRGKPGVFEWIVDQGQVTHRRFIPGGTTTGIPNQVPGAP
jgi:hypothetical protein